MPLTIPGLFTYDGYHDFFKKKGMMFVRQTLQENWVQDNESMSKRGVLR